MQIIDSIVTEAARFRAIRRDIHAHPELCFHEDRTSDTIATLLAEWGLPVHRGLGKTGVVAVIEGSKGPGRGIGLRADIDALPVTEKNTFAHVSTHPGKMHACGHDGHTAMLLAAAHHLSRNRDFAGRVVCIFQPAEEGGGGAREMIKDGLFDKFPVDAVFGMHNWPSHKAGEFVWRIGPMMAAVANIDIVVRGKGAHGAYPHNGTDPVLAASAIVMAMQSVVARNVNPLDEAVVSICAMRGGDLSAMSVIPRQVTLVGTVRTFRAEVQALVEKRLGRIVQSVAQAFGASAELHYERIYPATINTPQVAHYAAEVAAELVGDAAVVRDLPPSMGAEDFAFMLQARPGAYLRLGQGCEAGGFLHTPRYDFNDAVLPLGAALYARLAERALSQAAGTML